MIAQARRQGLGGGGGDGGSDYDYGIDDYYDDDGADVLVVMR